MSVSAKKIASVVAIVLVIAAAAGYFYFIPQQEKDYEREIAGFIDSLPGDLKTDSIKVNIVGGTAEIRGLRGTTKYLDGSDLTLDINSLTLSGVNLKAAAATGIVDLADSLTVSDCTMRAKTLMEGYEPMDQDIQFMRFSLNNLKGNFAELRALSKSDALSRQTVDALKSFSAGPVAIEGYVNTTNASAGSIIVSIDSFSAKRMSLLSGEDMAWRNVKLTAMNSNIINIDAMSVAETRIPDVFNFLLEAEGVEDNEALAELMLAEFKKEPLVAKKMTFEGFRFQYFMPEPLSIKTMVLDMELGAERLKVQKNTEGLVLPAMFYSILGMEARQFGSFYGKALELSSRLDVEVNQKDGAGEVMLREFYLQDPALASALVRAELSFDTQGGGLDALMDDNTKFLLKTGDLTLEDKALLDLYYQAEIQALKSRNTGEALPEVAALREAAAQTLQMFSLREEAPDQAAMAQGLAKLVQAPGKLFIKISPEAPIPLDGLLSGQVNAEVEFTPAQ